MENRENTPKNPRSYQKRKTLPITFDKRPMDNQAKWCTINYFKYLYSALTNLPAIHDSAQFEKNILECLLTTFKSDSQLMEEQRSLLNDINKDSIWTSSPSANFLLCVRKFDIPKSVAGIDFILSVRRIYTSYYNGSSNYRCRQRYQKDISKLNANEWLIHASKNDDTNVIDQALANGANDMEGALVAAISGNRIHNAHHLIHQAYNMGLLSTEPSTKNTFTKPFLIACSCGSLEFAAELALWGNFEDAILTQGFDRFCKRRTETDERKVDFKYFLEHCIIDPNEIGDNINNEKFFFIKTGGG